MSTAKTCEESWLLLVRDREDLDLAAAALRGSPCFVVAVCPAALREQARRHLKESLGERWLLEVNLTDQDDVPRVLTALGEEHLACLLPPDDPGPCDRVFSALNLHREKLRAAGSRFLLWIDGQEAFARFLRLAPDAYAFRSRVVVLRGERIVRHAGEAKVEPPELERARQRVKMADKRGDPLGAAEARYALASDLRSAGQLASAEGACREGLDLLEGLPEEERRSEGALLAEARLLHGLAASAGDRGDVLADLRYKVQSTEVLDALDTRRSSRQLLWVLSSYPGPPGFARDIDSLRRAEEMAGGIEGFAESEAVVRSNLGIALRRRGDLAAARSYFERAQGILQDPFDIILDVARLADLAADEGELLQAAELNREIVETSVSSGYRLLADHGRLDLAGVLALSGEHGAARAVLDTVSPSSPDRPEPNTLCSVLVARAELDLREARLDGAEDGLREAISLSSDAHLVEAYWTACDHLASARRQAADAGLVDPARLEELDRELELAQELAVASAGQGPPWFEILFLRTRAEHLAHRPSRLAEAIRLQKRALALCTDRSADLAPGCGRRLGLWLVRSGEIERGMALLDEAEEASVERHIPGERARIRSARLEAGVLAGLGGAELCRLLAAMREAARATGSRRIEAELLSGAARAPAATSKTPDPLPLADEARRLYADMPYPEEVGRCHETAADILMARGEVQAADRRYRQALGRYRRGGLELRRLALERKLRSPADPS